MSQPFFTFTFTYPLIMRVVGHHRWPHNQFSPFCCVLHCPLRPSKLQACPFPATSSHLFLCLPCLLHPLTVPCKMFLARPDEQEAWSLYEMHSILWYDNASQLFYVLIPLRNCSTSVIHSTWFVHTCVSFPLVTAESKSWCTDPTAFWRGESLGYGCLGGCSFCLLHLCFMAV